MARQVTVALFGSSSTSTMTSGTTLADVALAAPHHAASALLDHLATLTRNRIHYHHTHIEIDPLAEPTPEQRRAFDLIETTIPLTIAV